MKIQDLKKYNIPDKSGIYFFLEGKKILYIGKATSLRDRVRSYFGKDLINTRGPMILDMAVQATRIEWQETDSVLEAIILEANSIKKYQPKYNTKEKDNKSFNYVCITNEKIPKVLVVRGRNLNKELYQNIYGPFPNGTLLKDAMKIIRRIFPYIDNDSIKKQNIEFYKQLELTPDSLSIYKKNINNLKLFFQGKKKKVVLNLKKEMAAFSKSMDFENAARVRNQIFALGHINDVALIKEETSLENPKDFPASLFRIEAYDIAHMSGKNMVGVMTVITDGEVDRKEYKKFIIKTQIGANDTGALEEVLSRRFRHLEWGLPNLVVLDGSTAQINVANRILSLYKFDIPIVAVVKDDKHKAKAIMGDNAIIQKHKKSILLANSESHRFAISYYRQKSRKNMFQAN